MRRELIAEDVAWFVASMVAIGVYFMCAIEDTPFWAFGWLLAIPVLFAARFIGWRLTDLAASGGLAGPAGAVHTGTKGAATPDDGGREQ